MQSRLMWLVLVFFAVGIMSIGIVGCGSDEEAPETPTESTTSTTSTGGEEPAVVSRPPIDYAAEKKAIQDAYNAFYKAFNDFDIGAVQETFDTGNVEFGTIFAGNEPVPVATGWHNIKTNILGLWQGIGTKGNKWGQNSNLSKVWIRYKGSSLEACALGYNCYKGTYPGETHIYLVKKKDEWLINQIDSVTQQNIAIFGLDNAARPRIEKFFARGSDDEEDLAQ